MRVAGGGSAAAVSVFRIGARRSRFHLQDVLCCLGVRVGSRRKSLEFPQPCVTPAVLCQLQAVVQLEPDKRLSSRECVNHPYFEGLKEEFGIAEEFKEPRPKSAAIIAAQTTVISSASALIPVTVSPSASAAGIPTAAGSANRPSVVGSGAPSGTTASSATYASAPAPAPTHHGVPSLVMPSATPVVSSLKPAVSPSRAGRESLDLLPPADDPGVKSGRKG